MIIKGCSRAAPNQLGRHLLRTDTNECVRILELQSPVSDLTEALRDWQFLASGTKGIKGLYHANIDPEARYVMTEAQWMRSVTVLEEKLGFQGQPRAVVLHEKHGRQHIHVVWQRTDIQTMTLRTDSHNYRKHEEASLALEQEFGHDLVPGKHAKRDRQKQPELPRAAFNHAEWQQGERGALSPGDRKHLVTGLFEQSDTGSSLKAALEDEGFVLAQGDRRDFVIVDRDGQVFSLARQIEGMRVKELRAFLKDVAQDSLPTVAQAKDRLKQAGDLSPDELSELEKALKARQEEELAQLKSRQENERSRLSGAIELEAKEKLDQLEREQQAQRLRFEATSQQQHSMLAGLFARLMQFLIPGKAAETARQQEAERASLATALDDSRGALIKQLDRERQQALGELEERHAQQERDHVERQQEELRRYMDERTEARRLLAALDEQRHLEQKQQSRDGPERAR